MFLTPIKKYPYNNNVISNLGNYHLLTGNETLAINHYIESLSNTVDTNGFNTFAGDMDRFVEKGWRVEQVKKVRATILDNIKKNKASYIAFAELEGKAFDYYDKQQYQDAINVHRKVVEMALSCTPANYYEAVRNCYYIGDTYEKLKNKEEAIKAYKEGAEYVKRGNVVASIAAITCNYTGQLLKDQFKYDEALSHYLLAMDIYQKLENEENIAIENSNIGEVFYFKGDMKKAIEYDEKAISLDKKNNRISGLAIEYNNIGAVYKDLGEFTKAAECYDKAIQLGVDNNMTDNLSMFYNMKANLLLTTGDYQQALEIFGKAYSIDEKNNNQIKMGQRLSSMGVCYQNLGQIDKSIEVLERSISISEAQNDFAVLGATYNTLGAAYMDKKSPDQAKPYYEKALIICRRLNDKTTLAGILTNLSEIYTVYDFQPQTAKEYLKEAEGIFRQLKQKNELATILNNLGSIEIAIASYNNDWSQMQSCIDYFSEAIAIKEELRQSLKGDQRVKYTASIINSYEFLTSAYLFMGKYVEAFNTIEVSRAKSLSEKLASASKVVPVTIAQVQAGMSDKSIILYYANARQNPMSLIAITKTAVKGVQISKNNLISIVQPKYGTQIDAIVSNQRGFKKAELSDPDNTMVLNNEQRQKSNIMDDIINFYRTMLISPQSNDRQQVAAYMANELYKFLLSPVAEQLNGKDEITIVADGILAYLPFETLLDNNNKYLIESADVRYINSMTVQNLIKKRVYPATRKSLLAFGGATYESLKDNTPMIQSVSELYPLQKLVNQMSASNGSLRGAYASLGITEWQYLPGTLSEIKNIQAVQPDAQLVSGDDCNEKKVKTMSASNELANYKAIHFATHGLVVPEIPALSAIVLTLKKNLADNEDGYLTMNEIEKLKLKADFVDLSACETGLGKIYGGEGVVGLSQSLLIAGANSLSVSLWQVADESTSKFMVGVYQNKKNAPTSGYLHSICEMKRKFISGSMGEELKKPFYWAPFIFYGN